MEAKNEITKTLASKNREDVIEALRDTTFSIQHGFETSGAPPGYKVYKVNLSRVRCMEWDPIGRWEVLPNMILRLTKSPCELLIMFVDGFQQRFSFQEDDYRYITEGWLVVYTKTKAQCTRA